MKLKILVILIVLLVPSIPHSLDRCLNYKIDERVQSTKYFGLNFPYQYGIGQLKQESCCRADITAFDAGQGIAQFMPATSKYIQSLMGENLNPYNPEQAIKMQNFYMYRIHSKENFVNNKPLWIDYQIYNGGGGTLKKEYIRAGKIGDWDKMKAQCQRKVITLKSGKLLKMCDVNYDYSQRIFKYGNQYNPLPNNFEYW